MNYDPIAIVSSTFEHLREKPVGHIKFGLLMLGLLYGITFVSMCCGFGGGIAGMIAAEGNEEAQVGMMLAMYAGIFGLMFVLVPPTMALYYGYQKATLDEIDGKGDVGPGVAVANAMSMIGPLVAFTAIQCGAGIVGVMMCYIGVFFTSMPLRYAWLIKCDRDVGVMDAVALAWEGFWAKPGAHAMSMLVVFLFAMVLSYIPLIGPLILWPVIAVYEAKSYRALYGGGPNAEAEDEAPVLVG